MPKAESASSEAIMLINDNPGQETRIAIMREGRLDDLLSERPATATSVGNIYRGRVTNVEAAIQAANVHEYNRFVIAFACVWKFFDDGESNVHRFELRKPATLAADSPHSQQPRAEELVN